MIDYNKENTTIILHYFFVDIVFVLQVPWNVALKVAPQTFIF